MSDQTPADLADKVRKLAARFRQQMEPHVSVAECVVWERAAEAVETLLPAPPLPTLADMTEEERTACQWMQADVVNRRVRYVIANPFDEDDEVALIDHDGDICWLSPEYITPRPDLPRLEWPGNETPAPAPTPVLPDGWRLADHTEHGRVIVTTENPDDDGLLAFVHRAEYLHRQHAHEWCKPDELTYIDNDQEAADAVDL